MELVRARIEAVSETLFETTVQDPYRWMENWRGEELKAWVDAQGAYTRAYLDGLPERDALLARISELGDVTPSLTSFALAGERTFYLRQNPGDNVAKLIMRAGPDANEQVVLDPGSGAGEVHAVIDWYYPSHDGRLVAYGFSQGGSEESVLHVVETDTGRILDDAIARARFGGVQWLDDNASFLYHRLTEQAEGAPETDLYRDSRTYLHRLGDDPENDQPVFGNGINPRIELMRDDWPLVVLSSRSEWMIGVVQAGVRPEVTLYAAPRASLSDPATIPWIRVVDVEDKVAGDPLGGDAFALDGDTLYLRTFKGAPRYQIVAIDLNDPDMAGARTVIPPSEAVIEDIRLAGDYLLSKDLVAGIGRLRRVRLADGTVESIPLPVEGTITDWTTSPESGEALLQLSSWIVPPQVYRVRAAEGTVQDTGWAPPCPIDFSNVEAHETEYRSRDGVMVPISIIHRKGLERNGENPTLLYAYGSYGISMLPEFAPQMLAWYERGGVHAIAHIRGGGEYGKEWHEAGRGLNKQSTIDDFIAAAEYLIGEGYTRPERLAGRGVSAGGVPSGGGLVQRPDLWAAMVINVAVTNFLRFEFSENGPNNIPEFGSIMTEEGFRALQLIDSYTKIKDGVSYPAALITTGLNDPRVVVWQATKLAARLQAATASGKPVLLRVEAQGGHGRIGASRRQKDLELADMLAFLLQQMGVTPASTVRAGVGAPA